MLKKVESPSSEIDPVCSPNKTCRFLVCAQLTHWKGLVATKRVLQRTRALLIELELGSPVAEVLSDVLVCSAEAAAENVGENGALAN